MIITKRTKQCTQCEEIKPKADFHKNKAQPSGLSRRCASCKNETQKEYYQANKEKFKEYNEANKEKKKESHLRNTFGITMDEYDLNLELQDNACKICKVDASEFTKKLAVDHCHTTGEVRGLLCVSCNQGLGHFRDNIEFLEEAIGYLKNSKFFKMP